MPEQFNIASESELPLLANKIIGKLNSKVVAFSGDLGAGKTTFIKYLCKELGSEDHVSSPTFSLVNEYDSPNGNIYHFDFYRLKNAEEALDIGLDEYLDSGSYCFIEWPEKIGGYLDQDINHITIKNDFTQRIVTLHHHYDQL